MNFVQIGDTKIKQRGAAMSKQEEQVKRNDGCYQRGMIAIQYPVTDDEALYKFHLCQWLLVPEPDRRDQQVFSRRILDEIPQYLMGWNFHWHDEDVLEPLGADI